MGCRGVHFAIDAALVPSLRNADDDDTLAMVEGIESKWDKDWLYQTDKAWGTIHRCLTDGKLEWENGEFPLKATIIGGEILYERDDYIVCLIAPEQVSAVADALKEVTRDVFFTGYQQIAVDDYPGELEDEDFEYAWNWFEKLPAFFRKAADHGKAVIFTSDQ